MCTRVLFSEGRCGSISDGGEGVSYDLDETHDILAEMGLPKLNTHPPFAKRHSAAQEHISTFKKLRRLSRSLSIGHASSFRWRHRSGCRSVGTDPPSKSDHHHQWVSGGGGSGDIRRTKDSISGGEEDGDSNHDNCSCSSPPLSPAGLDENHVDGGKLSRFSAFSSENRRDLKEKVIDMMMTRRRSAGRSREDEETTENPAACVRTEDKVTQTSELATRLDVAKRVGTVYHVQKLEILPVTAEDRERVSVSRQENEKACGHHENSSATGNHICVAKNISGAMKLRNGNPEGDASGSSKQSANEANGRPKCLKKGAVHFASDNEIRFLDADTKSEGDLPQAFRDSLSAENLASSCSSGSTDASCLSSSQSKCDEDFTVDSQKWSRDVESAILKNNSLSMLRSAKSLIEQERRKRIRKLQSDLVKIQKELQDLDNLEYEVSEV